MTAADAKAINQTSTAVQEEILALAARFGCRNTYEPIERLARAASEAVVLLAAEALAHEKCEQCERRAA